MYPVYKQMLQAAIEAHPKAGYQFATDMANSEWRSKYHTQVPINPGRDFTSPQSPSTAQAPAQSNHTQTVGDLAKAGDKRAIEFLQLYPSKASTPAG